MMASTDEESSLDDLDVVEGYIRGNIEQFVSLEYDQFKLIKKDPNTAD